MGLAAITQQAPAQPELARGPVAVKLGAGRPIVSGDQCQKLRERAGLGRWRMHALTTASVRRNGAD